ncbi:hypothetical protein ATO3_16030 [Marinibacterium profundimaris]|uniref:Phosphate ABC transporter substrate-binding protein n=2 Tax=Marinibacterium profundimaris TaxID=1679460 RepID=A0A225NGR4_9RHOB|nr:hypothetical protein ATO3_16030 [Marinibacterium profundimaris]
MAPVQAANDAYWSAIRAELGHGPERMVRPDDLWPVWRAPDLLLAQTCSLPFRGPLRGQVTLVGTPDFGLPGCPPGHYRSAIVVRRGDEPRDGARMAINDPFSQSGWGNPSAWLSAQGITPGPIFGTGAHAASVRALAEGRADMAGIDLLSWTMFDELGLLPEGLEIAGLTEPSLGTPYITAKGRDPEPIARAIGAAIARLDPAFRDALHLKGFVQHGEAAYLAEAMPPVPAVAAA